MKEPSIGAAVILRFVKANFTIPYLRSLGRLTSLLFLLLASPAFGQAPGLAWTNNVGAKAFAVDALQNVYATANGSVIILNSAGAIVQSNAICPLSAIARRDASGNYYFLGSFDGTQDFGGITLVGGWTNSYTEHGPVYEPGYPTCFLAEYSSNGSLQWVVSFGPQSYRNQADDLALNPDGSLTVGYDSAVYGYLALFSPSGSNIWQTQLNPQSQYFSNVKVTPLFGTTGAFLEYNSIGGNLLGGSYNSSGIVNDLVKGPLLWQNQLALNSEPIIDNNSNLVVTALTIPNPTRLPVLTKWNTAGLVSSNGIGTVEQWQLAADDQGNIYTAGVDGSLSKYNSTGTLIWSGNYGAPTVSMIFDAQGNRYISRNDGSVGKLLPDSGAATAPMMAITPQSSGFTPQGFRFSLLGNPQRVYEIFTSTNLSSWQSAGLVTNASGLCQFTDPSATNGPFKLYRAVLKQ